MAAIIRIKRSLVTGNPTTLGAGELAYSALADNGSNGGDRLYIGMGTETAGNAVNRIVIGGKYFTDLVSAATNLNTASTIVRRDASGNFTAGTITAALTGTASSATALVTGRTISLTGDVTYTSGSFDGTGNVTGTATLANTTVTAGSYGSATAIPTFTVDSKGRLTAAGTATISTTLSIAADSGTIDTVALGTDTLTFTGGTGLDSVVSNNNITFNIDSTVATLTGTQTLTNKTLTSPTISAITGVSGNFVITAAAGNNSINLVPTGTGTVDAGSKRISGVAEPTQATDAATKGYVDTVAQGLHVHEAARVATTNTLAVLSGGTVTYNNGTLGVGATLTLSVGLSTIDGITLANNDRILVKNEATQANNGMYVRTSATVLTRASDFDTATEIDGGDFTFVEQGTLYGKTGWVQTFEVATVGTDTVLWEQFSGQGLYLAGNGLTLTGNTFDVVGTAGRISVTSDTVDIASTYVGQSTITTLGTIGTGTWNAGIISGTYGGTGVNNDTKTITLGGNLTTSGAFNTTLTTTANTSVTLPTTGTLATLAGTEALSNKTITLSSFSGTTVAASGNVTFTSTTDATAVGTAPVVLSGGLSVAKAIFVGTNITGAGPGTLAAPISVIDGFQIDGGTY